MTHATWMLLAGLYAGCVVGVSAWTGVRHWEGRRRGLLYLELALVGVLGSLWGDTVALGLLLVHAGVASRVLGGWALTGYWVQASATWGLVVSSASLGAFGASALLVVCWVGRWHQRQWGAAVEAERERADQASWRERASRQRARALAKQMDAEPAARRADVLNWINLTAGLTHSIGNEVLAFDHYSAVVLEYMEGPGADVPEHVRSAVRFIHDTNSARLGFINFLQEFAEIMKLAGAERRVPLELRQIELTRLIHRARAQVGRFESHELDPDDDDPQIQRQRRKNLDLELIVHAEDESARTLTRGRQPVLEFICYEFIKNSLRNCSGQRRLKVQLASRESRVRVRFINDLDVRSVDGPACAACGAGGPLFRLRSAEERGLCDGCLRLSVEENLSQCWAPGRTSQGGKGLGLFVIRHFLTSYYFGSASAGVLHWPTREVYFEVLIPDDLALAIGDHNARLNARPA